MTLIMVIVVAAAVLFTAFCVLCLYSIHQNRKDYQESKKKMWSLEKEISAMGTLVNQKTSELETSLGQRIDKATSAAVEANANAQKAAEIAKTAIPAEPAKAAATPAPAKASDPEKEEVDLTIEEINEDAELEALLEELEKIESEKQALPEQPLHQTVTHQTVAHQTVTHQTVEHQTITQAAQPVQYVQPVPQMQPVPPQPAPQIQPAPQMQPVPPQPVPQVQPAPQVQPVPQAQPIPQAQPVPPPQPSRHHQGYSTGRSGKTYSVEELSSLIK